MSLEYIKKLMGWCPNAKAHVTRQHVNLENFDSNVPDRVRGDNSCLKNPGWLRKKSNQILLFNISLTFVYLLMINLIDINLFYLLAGFFVALSQLVLHWNKQMKQYDDIARKPIIRYGSKEKYLPGLLFIILSILFVSFFTVLSYMFNFGSLSISTFFLSILWFFMWGSYFQLIYWEIKNHMKICIIFENSLEKIYALGKNEGEM
ncbi:hypothetical protein MSSIH_3820 [Methanosarcina siciliae HI350]|uniref:DUF1673 domain-containing protein n=1 Tax=Methanosarcina siciliae HI350 TaxID=1434119 RepID=A0A0E3PIS4_9EURY|nr:DUF1673 domain-containing protein [Methanosarcina siciliae]AKB34510.1 hypothetical protein MSSIH_3820 [Methanosarcina siciliae HI350]